MFIWKVVFFISIWMSADGSHSKIIHSCEHSELQIVCEEGRVIHIIRANYGRLSNDLCNGGRVNWNIHCISNTSHPIMIDRCEQKKSCSVQASNTVFGDPCGGTIKYLEIQYACVSRSRHFKTVYSCEHKELQIGCVEGRIIHIIRANYGRLARDLCNDDGQVAWSGGNCKSKGSLRIITDRCDQKQSCSISASNTVFGDPCRGTIKYLEVQYECVSHNRHFKTHHSCEHNQLNIECVAGRVIRIIRANYGRLAREVCNVDGQVAWSGGNCMSEKSLIIMTDRCNQKQSCSVPASNTVFGDPCSGTIKYLEVQYTCDSPSSTASKPTISNNSTTSETVPLPDTSLDSRHFKTAYSCEHKELHIRCMEGKVIHIIRANYGRLTRHLCNDDGKVAWSDENCMSERSFLIMTDRCDQKQSCSVPAANSIFGDPCSGTIKYLEVQYACVSHNRHSKTHYSCEHKQLHIGCMEGKVINIIHANYGRLTRDLCNDDGKVMWSGGNCMSERSLLIMTDRCNQKKSCSVPASNSVFGDPCFGTIKYLQVQYTCVSHSKPFKTVHTCEHRELHIRCVEGRVIHIIRANYGRLTRDVCNDDGQVSWSSGTCMSERSLLITTDRCDQKQSCTVPASNTVFGDPCTGTIKYLEVQYACVSPSNFASTTSISSNSTALLHDPSLDSRLFKTHYSCEHNQLHIGCVKGRAIHIIRANYGRLTRDLCNGDGQVSWSGGSCMSEISFLAMTDRCDRKHSCTVPASNTVFGDPCTGTIKYLEVQYACVSPDSRHFKAHHTCEHKDLHIGCVEGRVIHIIRANYGRLTRDLCNDDGQVAWSGERCVSERSLPIMTDRCEQKQSCSVPASNTVFGDPCAGTIKYLEVQYACVSPSKSSTTTTSKPTIFIDSSTSDLEQVPDTTLASKSSTTTTSKPAIFIDSSTSDLEQVPDTTLASKSSTTTTSKPPIFIDLSTSDLEQVPETTLASKSSTTTTSKPTIFIDSSIYDLDLVTDTSSASSSLTTANSIISSGASTSGLDSSDTTLGRRYETIYACENNMLQLGCENGEVIQIIEAIYGRLNNDLCNDDGKVEWTRRRCSSLSTYPIMTHRCDKKQNCSVEASSATFGDPCYETIKYLEVQYVCVSPSNFTSTTGKPILFSSSSAYELNIEHGTPLDSPFETLYSCEDTELTVKCQKGRVIHIVRANYGRFNFHECNDYGQVEWTGRHCTSDRTYIKMFDRCEQKQNCSIHASSSIFGDPCNGTEKYLEVQYLCVSPSDDASTIAKTTIFDVSSASDHFKTIHACENKTLQVGCEEGRVIQINEANYGRLNIDVCNDDGKVEWTRRRCSSYNAYFIMSDRCQGKQTCSVQASNAVFGHIIFTGNPCRGTIKYLEVQYACVSRDSLLEFE